MGTIGGSVAHADPASDMPAVLLALGAQMVVRGSGGAIRTVEAGDFFKGLFETALGAGELITSVTLPIPKKAGYAKFKNPASRFAIVGVFVAQTASGVRVAVTGAGANGVFRVKAMEDALSKSWSPQAIKDIVVRASDLQTDLHASAEYRAHLVMVMAQRAVAAAS